MRIILRGLSDTVELRLSDGAWTAGGDENFGILVWGAHRDEAMSDLYIALRARTVSSGNAVLRVEKRSPRVSGISCCNPGEPTSRQVS